jgi:DNA polymerase-3 subunit beta
VKNHCGKAIFGVDYSLKFIDPILRKRLIMKVDFNRNALAEALGLVTPVVPSKTPKPILQCVCISAEEKEVRICATDLEVGINYVLSEVQVNEPGDIVVPADRLSAIVRESTDDVLSLEAKEGTCQIRGADSHFTVYGQQADQYPAVPQFQDKADIEIDLMTLQAGIEQCLFATAKESTRYALNGVLWEIKGKKLSLVATDGRRLAKSKVALAAAPDKKFEEEKIIIPAKAMMLLDKLGGSDKDIVSIKLTDNQVLISCSNVVISSNLVEGNFPKYEDIIPTDHDKKITLSTEQTLSAVRRAALLTSDESRGIQLAIEKDKIVFTGRAPEAGDAEVAMAIEYSGEPIQIGFNPNFLIDVMRVIQTPQFQLELGQADRPGLIKSGQNFLYVLMPINLG